MPYREDSSRIVPAAISLVIAIVCAMILGTMIYDRWHEHEIKSAEQAEHATTGSAAGKSGAKFVPTDPAMSVGPAPSAPGPVQPAKPD
jgi:hypothetical protein